MIQMDKKLSQTNSRNQQVTLILVGTAYMDQGPMPSRGRLLIFKLHTKECRLELLKEMDLQGSVQAISSLRENHKFLTIGQNNKVSLYSF